MIALFFALGGASFAAADKLLPRNSVRSPQVVDNSLLKRDFKKGQLPAGPRGPAGLQGPTGSNGARGASGAQGPAGVKGASGVTGPAGSPDTPAQVLAKIRQVDGSASGLDADFLDGSDTSSFVRLGATVKRLYRVIPHDASQFVTVLDRAGVGAVAVKCPLLLADGQLKLTAHTPMEVFLDSSLSGPTFYLLATSGSQTWTWAAEGDSQTLDIGSGASNPALMWSVRVQEDNQFTNGCHIMLEDWLDVSG